MSCTRRSRGGAGWDRYLGRLKGSSCAGRMAANRIFHQQWTCGRSMPQAISHHSRRRRPSRGSRLSSLRNCGRISGLRLPRNGSPFEIIEQSASHSGEPRSSILERESEFANRISVRERQTISDSLAEGKFFVDAFSYGLPDLPTS